MNHEILNLYLVFFNYDIILVWVVGSVKIYLADYQTSRNRKICYLSLQSEPKEYHLEIQGLFLRIHCLNFF